MGLTGPSPFDEAIAVRPAGSGRYEITPDGRFALYPSGDAPPAVNGGVLIATALRAVLADSPHPHPIATSAHFLRIAALAPAQVQVSWLRQGRTAATARATLVQGGRPVLEVTATTGTLAPAGQPASTGTLASAETESERLAPGALSWTGAPPSLPPIGECATLDAWPGGLREDGTPRGYPGQVSLLFDPAVIGWRHGRPAGVPEMRAYFSLVPDRVPDAYQLALAVDALPPVVFGLGASGWSPTVELTWFMRAVPAPGPLRVAARCRHVSQGWFDEEAEVWDAAGALVAQSRQIARVGRGPRPGSAPAG